MDTEAKRITLHGREIDLLVGDEDFTPALSVLVPVYDAEDTLVQALDSIRSQEDASLEIVCIDDASPDGSSGILDDYLAQDSRFVIIRHHSNAGYGASLNDGLAIARGEWISILEPDDYIKGDMYKTAFDLVKTCDRAPDVIKMPYYREIREEGTERGFGFKDVQNCSFYRRVSPTSKSFDLKTEIGAEHLLRHHPSIWSALYRKEFLDSLDICFTEYPGAGWADNEFFYKTLLFADDVLYIDAPFYVYREETPSEFRQFRERNADLPFERWHSMQDVIDVLDGEIGKHVRRAHIATGFTYLASMECSYQEVDNRVRDNIDAMFSRMDPSLVVAEESIPPGLKKFYLERMHEMKLLDQDIETYQISSFPYYRSLFDEFLYSIKANGLKRAIHEVAGFLKE